MNDNDDPIGQSVRAICAAADDLVTLTNKHPERVRLERKILFDAWNAIGFTLSRLGLDVDPYGEAAE